MSHWTSAVVRRVLESRALFGLLALALVVGAACSETQSSADGDTGDAAPDDAVADEPLDIETVVVIGDSLTEGSEGAIAEALPASAYDPLLIDGSSGRRSTVDASSGPNGGVDAIEQARAAGHEPDAWVIALGTNDVPHYDAEGYATVVTELLEALPADAPLVWVDVYLRDAEEQESEFNSTLRSLLAERPNTVVAEWTSKAWQDGVMSSDGIHPTSGDGTQAFAGAIVEGLDTLNH